MISRIRLDDLVQINSASTNDPAALGIERSVGLENIVSNQTRIAGSGVAGEGYDFTRVFRNGDVLVSKRNLYLCKTAVADFDGVCSGDILVVEASDPRLESRYLGYLLSSPMFYSYAISSAKGTHSRRIRPIDLERFEFDLPSLDEQLRVVEVMRAVDREIEAAQAVASATSLTMSTLDLSSFQRRPLLEVSTVVRGLRLSPERRMTAWPTYRTVRAGNISWAGIDFDDFREMKASPVELKNFVLKGGDILMVEGGGPDSVGVSAIFPEDGPPNLLPQDSLLLIQARQGVSAQYLYWALRNVMLSGELARIASGSTITHLTKEAFVKISIPVPDLPTQDQIVHSFSRLQSLQLSANEAEQRGQVLRTSLLQELIG